jgi:predicted O-methyltransferase YrrM
MHWKEAFTLSLINHRAPCLAFICWALDIEVRTIVEIGVNKGETSQLFRHLFPDAHLFLIDPWKLTNEYNQSGTPISRKIKHYDNAYNQILSLFQDDPKATVLRMSSQEAIAHLPNSLDLVFIDANHEYLEVRKDILSWLPKVRRGGLLAGHDYDQNIPMFSGVKQAVDEIFGRKILLGKDRVWAHRKL